MDNIHIGNKGIKWVSDNQVSNKKALDTTITNTTISKIDNSAINEITVKLNDVIQDTCAQYQGNTNKELSDAIIQLQSAMRSLLKFNN